MPVNTTNLRPDDILTEVTRYNLIRNQRLVYLDVHHAIKGLMAANYVCVPNLINIVAEQQYQGAGHSAEEALNDCLAKIKDMEVTDIFPQLKTAS